MTNGTGRTLYQAMGVAPTADAAELREAYLRLARTLHPDRCAAGSPGEKRLAERRIREVNAAWEVLGRPDARAQYDADLFLRRRSEASSPRRSSSRDGAAPSGARTEPARVHAAADSDDDDVELSAVTVFLLRRGPIIVLLFIALGLFVGTALARHGDPASSTTTSVTSCEPGTCAGTPGGG